MAVNRKDQTYSFNDDEALTGMSYKYKTLAGGTDIDSKFTAIKELKARIIKDQQEEDARNQTSGGSGGVTAFQYNAGVPKGERAGEYEKLEEMEEKLSWKKSKTDIFPIIEQSLVRTDQSGNLFKKFVNGVATLFPETAAFGQAAKQAETVVTKEKLTEEFSYGLNGLKYSEPVQYERVVRYLKEGVPLSSSMVANITAKGLEAKESINKDLLADKKITKDEYNTSMDAIQKARYNNLVDDPETLRAFISEGIANKADRVKSITDQTGVPGGVIALGKKMYGHTWNYSDAEIAQYGMTYAQENGIDPHDARVKAAIKYLQDNEGAFIMQNSIAKTGWSRNFGTGLAIPFRGMYNTLGDIGRPLGDVYAEGQSQGNVNAAEAKLKRTEHSWEGKVGDVMEGAGQFISQVGLSAMVSSGVGALGARVVGRAGMAILEGDIVAADMGAKTLIGRAMIGSKDAVATVVTSYAMVYDQNLKTALTYTSDDTTARVVANGMSALEGATELVLSPLQLARGLGKAVMNRSAVSKGLIGILSDAAVLDKNIAIKAFLKGALKGGQATGYVIGSEIGEEEVVQLADFATNLMLNPTSQAFKERDLGRELASTAYQTGLSMAIPALLSGIGATRVNTFSKGSLVIAAQNRKQMLDDMNKALHEGGMTQAQYDEKAAIINLFNIQFSHLQFISFENKNIETQKVSICFLAFEYSGSEGFITYEIRQSKTILSTIKLSSVTEIGLF